MQVLKGIWKHMHIYAMKAFWVNLHISMAGALLVSGSLKWVKWNTSILQSYKEKS